MKTPISLIVDDSAPVVFVSYYCRSPHHTTKDGRILPSTVPVSFLSRFADVVERHGISGKFSVIPVPGAVGRIDRPIPGVPERDVAEWITIANGRLSKYFDFCPEINTHYMTWDIVNARPMDVREDVWCDSQNAETLTPYIAYALQILKNVGIDATGVTSPWAFGEHVENDYALAIGRAMEQVWGRKDVWYFLRSKYKTPHARPWISATEDGRRIVAIPGTIGDGIWKTMDSTDTSPEYISAIADQYITADGKDGEIIKALDIDAWPIMTTHWQSLFSAGNETGLHALNLVAQRVNKHLSDYVQWTNFSDLMKLTL